MANPREQGQFLGEQIADYIPERLLGRGGMGEAYLASYFHKELVVVKVMLGDQNKPFTKAQLDQFEKEANALETLSPHPNIVQFLRYGKHQHQGQELPFIVMEYAPAGSVADYIRNHDGLSPDQAVDFTKQVTDGLQYAHDNKVLHRDLKPQNLLLVPERKSGDIVVLISDFGLTRTAHSLTSNTKDITDVKHIYGTWRYMPAEQFQGKEIDRSDIYATGIMLYEFMTGEVPFKRDDFLAYFFAHKDDPVPDLTAIRRQKGLSEGEPIDAIAAIVKKALEKKPEDRYPRAGDMGEELISTYTAAKNKAKLQRYYSLAENLRVRNVNPDTLVDLSLPLDDRIHQLQARVLYLTEQELAQQQQENTALDIEKQFLLIQSTREKQQLQQELQGVREALRQEQQNNADLQDALVRKEAAMEEMGERLDLLEAEKADPRPPEPQGDTDFLAIDALMAWQKRQISHTSPSFSNDPTSTSINQQEPAEAQPLDMEQAIVTLRAWTIITDRQKQKEAFREADITYRRIFKENPEISQDRIVDTFRLGFNDLIPYMQQAGINQQEILENFRQVMLHGLFLATANALEKFDPNTYKYDIEALRAWEFATKEQQESLIKHAAVIMKRILGENHEQMAIVQQDKIANALLITSRQIIPAISKNYPISEQELKNQQARTRNALFLATADALERQLAQKERKPSDPLDK